MGKNPSSVFLLFFVADVCFLRLDFEEFSIRGTGGTAQTNEGVCLDTFTVTVSLYGIFDTGNSEFFKLEMCQPRSFNS